MNEAMSAEFGTVAEWTADAAVALGKDHFVPAGCRGSGGQPALDWLLERLRPSRGTRLLDCGAGIGGPAAYAAQTGLHAVVLEPEAGACRAARRLFDLPVIRAEATSLPFADATFHRAWCLGVVCTLPDQLGALTELARVLTPTGRLGLLVYTIDAQSTGARPEGNNFPTASALDSMCAQAGLLIESSGQLNDLGEESAAWTRRVAAVSDRVQREHGGDEALRSAERQSGQIAALLEAGELVGSLRTLRHREGRRA